MKLNRTMRDAFVSAAMADVPVVNYVEQINKVALDKAVELLPAKVRAVWQDKTIRHHLTMMNVQLVDGNWQEQIRIEVPGLRGDTTRPEKAVQAACADLAVKIVEQRETRRELERNLRAVAESCVTRKALADALPEFARYLPADEADAQRKLPVVANVVTNFVKAGWPKGQKPTTKAPLKKAT